MKTVFSNCVILDGSENMQPITGKALVVEDETIAELVDMAELGAARFGDARIYDLGGKYLLPGLINLHVHLALSGLPPKKEKKKPVNYKALYGLLDNIKPVQRVFESLVAKYAKLQLLSGTTTIRTVGGLMDFDAKVRDKINDGKISGPRILCANTAISVPGGHFAGSLGTEAKSVQEAIEDVRRVAASKPDLIKIMITGGVMDCEVLGEPGIVKMPVEIVKAACDEAHRLGYKVAAHVESTEGMRIALENGVDTIEHGGKPSDEVIELFKKTGAALISTTSPAIPYALMDRALSNCSEEAHINGLALHENMIECTKQCIANGVKVGLGTDASCPFVTHYDTWRELVYFNKYCGASERLALHTATLGNARIIGIDDITGSIEAGKAADLIVVADNPLENLKTLKNVEMVMCRGKLIEEPHIKRYDEIDKALDVFM